MSSSHRYWNTSRSIAALILIGVIAFAAAGCGPDYGYAGYPGYGYAPYSYGWGNRYYYDPNFVVHHPWEEHHDYGHHTEFYHGGGGAYVGHEGGGFHGGGGGFHGGGGGGHGGGGHR